MKKWLLTTVALAALGAATSASAADLAARPYTKAPPVYVAPPVAGWSGFYIGAQGGYGWGDSKETYFSTPNTAIFNGTQSYDVNGGTAGGVIGYNWQSSAFVFGIEGDYNWADIRGRSGIINTGLGDTYYTRLRSYGDIKGRIGYAPGPALFYVNGGVAFGDLQHRYDAALNGGAANSFANSSTRTGWTVGAGVEYMFAPSWSVKVEYNYVDFGTSSIQYSATPATNRSEWKDTFSVIKAGVNYHFNWGGPVVARY